MTRRGFTLSETLVILAIVALAIGLLVPAVQQAQQDARAARCKNNLHQLGLAMYNYHEVYARFPPGWISREGAAGTGPRSGWQVCLTPFVDEAALFNQINFLTTPADPKNRLVYIRELKAFRCPADRTPPANTLRGDFGTSNYSGNYGSVPFPRWTNLGLGDFWPGAVDAPMTSNGFFARNSSLRMRDFSDGPSNILMISERCYTSAAGVWMGVTDNSHEDDTLTDMSHSSRPNAGRTSFSSLHGPGVFALMGDGAVRFINNSIDSKPGPAEGAWQRLACRNDGNVVPEF